MGEKPKDYDLSGIGKFVHSDSAKRGLPIEPLTEEVKREITVKDGLVEGVEDAVRIVRIGEERKEGNMFYAPATITSISDGDERVIVDAGCIGEEVHLKKVLKNMEIPPEDITNVLITHNHPDHYGCAGIFKRAIVTLPDSRLRVSKPNKFAVMNSGIYGEPGKMVRSGFSDKIVLISTPGHAGWDFSVMYRGKNSRVLMCGDLFWSTEDWINDTEFLELCLIPNTQRRSRDYVRETLKPDIIVPGHGPAFAPQY